MATQHVAVWPVATVLIEVSVPLEASEYVERAFVPASAITMCPTASKFTAKGTAPGSALTTGDGERYPKGPTRNTSMSLPLAFVVTNRLDPSGVNAT